MGDPSEFGFRSLDPKTWLTPDATSRILLAHLGKRAAAQRWVEPLAAIQLAAHVPLPVRSLFETGTLCCAYGWFGYPLLVLGFDQCVRAGELALKMVLPNVRARATFGAIVRDAKAAGILTGGMAHRWDGLVVLRNAAAHPDSTTLLPLGSVVRLLNQLAADIGALIPTEHKAGRRLGDSMPPSRRPAKPALTGASPSGSHGRSTRSRTAVRGDRDVAAHCI